MSFPIQAPRPPSQRQNNQSVFIHISRKLSQWRENVSHVYNFKFSSSHME